MVRVSSAPPILDKESSTCYNKDMAILTIWHNNLGRPIPCLGLVNGYAGHSGISPFSSDSSEAVVEWVRTVQRYGAAAITDDRNLRPLNHQMSGVGGGHNDADWCESRFLGGSQASWYENEGSAFFPPYEAIVRRAQKGDR